MRKSKPAPVLGVVYNKFFVHYDNDSNVHLISNVKDDTLNNFEIDIDLIPNFISGKKQCRNYKIEYFIGIADGTIDDDDEPEILTSPQNLLYTVPMLVDKTTEIVIEHNRQARTWTFIPKLGIESKLKAIPNIPFYVFKLGSPSELFSTYVINPADLLSSNIVCKFNSDEELDLSNLSIFTIKKFKSYGIKEKNE